jgi:sulfate permease, SulP family
MIQFTPKLVSVLKNGYSYATLRSDALAGLTVAIVALPLAMALGIASGATPEQGIITAIIAGFLISLLGGSRVQIGGPTGAFVVIIFSIIAQHGYGGLLLATFLAGLILVAAGYLGLGKLIKFIPQPVITGFTMGIAVIIASTQIKDFFGLRIDQAGSDFFEKWSGYLHAFANMDYAATSIGILTVVAIVVIKKFSLRLPSYLIAVVLASAAAAVLNWDVDTIGSRFPAISAGIPFPKLPEFSLYKVQQVLPSAFIIAFLAGVEALLSAVVADGMTGYKHRSNQELIAQGIANCSSALFGGVPATGAIARTATNITAGGKTPIAGIFHAVFLLLFILFAADSMKVVPMPALAAILFFVAWQMSERHQFARMIRLGGSDRLLLLLTFVLTVVVDLTVAIGVGFTLASLLFMARMSRSVEISSGVKGEFGTQAKEDYQREDLPDGVEVFWIAGPIFFGVASNIPELLNKIGEKPKILIIRMRLVPFLDATGASAMEDLVKQCRSKGIGVIFSALQGQPEAILLSHQFKEGWEDVGFAPSYKEALALAKEKMEQVKKS